MVRKFPGEGRWAAATVMLIAVACALVLSTYDDYGVAFDEYALARYGDAVRKYFLSLGSDRSFLQEDNLVLYGALISLGGSFARTHLPLSGEFEALHLYGGLIGVLGILCAGLLAWEAFGDRRAMFFAALTLCLTCRYSGESFNNLKDVPFAAAYGWALAALIRFMKTLPRPPWKDVLHLAAASGVLLSIRVGGMVVWLYLLLGICACLVLHKVRLNSSEIAVLLLKAALVCAGSYLLMVLFWPWAHASPLGRPLAMLLESGHFRWNGKVLFWGERIFAVDVPWSYALTWLLIGTPVLFLLLIFVSLIRFIHAAIRLRTAPSAFTPATVLLHFAWLFPLIWASVSAAVLYDGFRHLLFVYMPLAALAGREISVLFERFGTKRTAMRVLVILLSIFYLRIAAYAWRLYPYQYVYFNDLIGGLAGAHGRFETEYWGTSFKEAVLWLAKEQADKRYRAASSQH
ncbi:MAG TPA: hypothetical protein PLP17_00925, partial [Oligoflexia bacterium]|nr:hypothetical protein [Oligoflexia bacterium]